MALVPARRADHGAARVQRGQARDPVSVRGRADRVPAAGLRKRTAAGCRLVARVRRRLRGRGRNARSLLRELRDHAVHRRQRLERLGQRVRVAGDRGDDPGQHDRGDVRLAGCVGDGRRPARRVHRLHRRDDHERRLRPPCIQRLPAVLEDHLQHRVDVLRVPRLRRDDVHGRQAFATPSASCRERWLSHWD